MSIDATRPLHVAPHQSVLFASLQQSVTRWFVRQQIKIQISRERRELKALPPYLLKDIGINSHEAYRESMRASSDIPCNRKP